MENITINKILMSSSPALMALLSHGVQLEKQETQVEVLSPSGLRDLVREHAGISTKKLEGEVTGAQAGRARMNK